MKGYLILFVALVFSMVAFVICTAHTGTLRKPIVPTDRNMNNIDWDDVEEGHRNDNLKAVIGTDTVDYYAASDTRCDELYKYCHCIGRGTITGLNQLNYFYVPNDSFRLITVEQLIAEQNEKKSR